TTLDNNFDRVCCRRSLYSKGPLIRTENVLRMTTRKTFTSTTAAMVIKTTFNKIITKPIHISWSDNIVVISFVIFSKFTLSPSYLLHQIKFIDDSDHNSDHQYSRQ